MRAFRAWVAATAVWWLSASVAQAGVVINPDWIAKPSGEDMAEKYPPLAIRLGLSGGAFLVCTIDATGQLAECKTPWSAPKGLGFDRAALDLTPHFRMRPKIVDGRPVDGGVVRIPLSFRLPPTEQAPPTEHPATPSARTLDLARQVASLSDTDSFLGPDPGLGEDPRLDPIVLKAATAALRQGREEASHALIEEVALILADSLSRDELVSWLAYLKSPAALALKQHQAEITAAWRQIASNYHRATLAGARERFCKSRDCAISPDLEALRRMAATREVRIRDPEWSESPSPTHIRAAYPVVARVLEINGWALLRCRASILGLLQGCAPVAEKPAGLGFGAAALGLTGRYRLSTRMIGQGADKETIEFPIVFATGWATQAAPPTAVTPRPGVLALGRQILSAGGSLELFNREATDKAAELMNAPEADLDWNAKWQASQAFWDAVGQGTPSLIDSLSAVYGQYLSDAELQAYLAFLQSPAGRLASRIDSGRDGRVNAAVKVAAAVQTATAREIFCTAQDCSTRFDPVAAGVQPPAIP